eukprot:743262-Pyramimonas_sp.AAC.1
MPLIIILPFLLHLIRPLCPILCLISLSLCISSTHPPLVRPLWRWEEDEKEDDEYSDDEYSNEENDEED